MFCTTCGKKLSDDAMFCAYCGTSVNMRRGEEIPAEPPQDSQPGAQSMQSQDSQTLTQPVQMQVPQPITLPMPPQLSQPGPQPTQQQVTQSIPQPVQQQATQTIPQPTQQQATQSIPQPVQQQATQTIPQPVQQQAYQPIPQYMQHQASQPIQNPRVQYVARPAGAPVAGVTEAPKKKRGWIVAVALVSVIVVVGLSYLLYLVMVAYLRDAMDAAYKEQYHEWNSYDDDTERPWNIPGFSQDETENSDENHNSEGVLSSDEKNDQYENNDPDGNAGEDDNVQPSQPDWNEGNGSNDDYGRGDDVYAYDGAGFGYVRDIIHTYWFDFTVNNTMFCQTFQGYTARNGYQLIVLDLTIENTFEDEVPMFDTDFWVEWGEDYNDFDGSYPVPDSYDISHDFLPEHYYLSPNDIVTGLLMYEVPVGYSEYMLIFEEYFEDGDVGDWFGVYLYSDAGPNIHVL